MQKAFVYFFIFIFLSLLGNFAADYSMARQVAGRSPYYLCFASIGAISLESRLDCWAKLEANLDDDEMCAKLADILKPLNISPAYGQITLDHQNQIRKLHFNCINKGVDYQVLIASSSEGKGTDFIVTIKTEDSRVNLQEVARRLKSNGLMDWKAYFLYSGKMPEPLNQAAQNELMKVVLKPFKGQEINRYQDNRMTVVTAYSPVLDCDSVDLAGRDCNLQASVRRDAITNVSYVYLGSPLILGDY
ncbi:MAG: YwmB family TATA-box binding protein [Deltaproteobacteria bacterium]